MQDTRLKNKCLLGDRILMLSQKINSLKFGNEAIAEKKIESLEKNLEQLSESFQKANNNFQQQSFEVKHLFAKIQKEIAYDYHSIDRMVKEQLSNTQKRYLELTDNHLEQRRNHDSKIMKLIDDKCVVIRDLIDAESKDRQSMAEQIESSLSADLVEIRDKLQLEKKYSTQNFQNTKQDFIQQISNLKKQLNEICSKQSESEGQLYKMLRDLLKKVKSEIAEDRLKRQSMEEQILVLIQKMCDKAIQEVPR